MNIIEICKIGSQTYTAQLSGVTVLKMSVAWQPTIFFGITALVEPMATSKYHLCPNKEMEDLNLKMLQIQS